MTLTFKFSIYVLSLIKTQKLVTYKIQYSFTILFIFKLIIIFDSIILLYRY